MKAIDMNAPEDKFLKALVYGLSGTGKTSFGVSAPRPLILLSEQQALPHLRAAAKRLGRPMPDVLVMESLDDYRAVLTALRADKSQPFRVRDVVTGDTVYQLDVWPETVVLDSLTDACELVSEEIRTQSPPKIGKDGLPVDSERYWNVFRDRAQKLIRAFRDLPMNVLYLCLLDDRMVGEDENKVRWVGPQLAMRSLPSAVQAAVNVVGVTYRKRTKDGVEYGIRTTGPDFMQLKPFPPLRDYEVTDFASWCQRVSGIDDGTTAPPPPSDESPTASAAGDVETTHMQQLADASKKKSEKKNAKDAAQPQQGAQ